MNSLQHKVALGADIIINSSLSSFVSGQHLLVNGAATN
jgi:hypothetical protein